MKTLQNHILKYGLLTTAGLIVFFLMMRITGLAEITELRSLNAVIMFAGVFLCIKHFKHNKLDTSFGYLSGIAAGFFTGIVVAISFSVFVGIYVALDPVFLAAIVTDNAQKEFLNPWTSAMVIFIEAMASGMLFSYTSMQYLKTDVVSSVTVKNED